MEPKLKCNKKRFSSRSSAKKYLKLFNRKRTYNKKKKTVYHCEECDCYHTSSRSKSYHLKRIEAYKKYGPKDNYK
jgi:hypothetical protein